MTNFSTKGMQGKQGAALLFAISLLALFSVFGACYVRLMSLEVEKAKDAGRRCQARHLATAGVNAAIAELQRAFNESKAAQFIAVEHKYEVPLYASEADLDRNMPLDNRLSEAVVTISDENGKVNLNHAPVSLLQRILGIDGVTARNITRSLPRSELPGDTNGRWLLGVDELLGRDLLSPEQYSRIDHSLVTTDTVLDHDNPSGFININSAPREVMAAILDIEEFDEELFEKRKNLKSLASLENWTGKDPATYTIKPDPANPAALPAALALSSNCFRITSEARFASILEETGRTHHGFTARAEAVVLFDLDGSYQIVSWTSQKVIEESEEVVPPAEETPEAKDGDSEQAES